MSISKIENNVKQVLLTHRAETFIFDLLAAYGKPKASITRLQATGTGSYNLSRDADSVLWKNNVYFTQSQYEPSKLIEQMKASEAAKKHRPRFIIATDFNKLSAWDTKTEEGFEASLVELPSKFAFFLPWAGMEKAKQVADSPADVKAAEKMAKLYDLILEDNQVSTDDEKHSLNVFLSRVLFCLFAEDTEIFADKLFTNSVQSHTAADGSDLQEYLQHLFTVLNTESRDATSTYLKDFPYVNGGLFQEDLPIPKFNKRSRDLLIKCGSDLNWSEINPDIFGSMIQAVVDVDQRSNMGMHYTSVRNIKKVIEPLFLTELREEAEKAKDSPKKLEELLCRLTQIRIFDRKYSVDPTASWVLHGELDAIRRVAYCGFHGCSCWSGAGSSDAERAGFSDADQARACRAGHAGAPLEVIAPTRGCADRAAATAVQPSP